MQRFRAFQLVLVVWNESIMIIFTKTNVQVRLTISDSEREYTQKPKNGGTKSINWLWDLHLLYYKKFVSLFTNNNCFVSPKAFKYFKFEHLRNSYKARFSRMWNVSFMYEKNSKKLYCITRIYFLKCEGNLQVCLSPWFETLFWIQRQSQRFCFLFWQNTQSLLRLVLRSYTMLAFITSTKTFVLRKVFSYGGSFFEYC